MSNSDMLTRVIVLFCFVVFVACCIGQCAVKVESASVADPANAPHATSGPAATPAPQDPHYTGYQCDWQNVYHCTAWMYVPETFTNTYYGSVESADFIFGGYTYDEAERTWTIEMYFEHDVACGQFALLWVREGGTDRLMDSIYMETHCIMLPSVASNE